MYSPKVIERRLQNVQQTLKREIVYRSLAKTDEWKEHLTKLYNPDAKQLVREVKKQEREFIENEQILFQFDFRYAAEHYFKVMHWSNKGLVTPQLSIAQNIMLDCLAEHEERGIAFQAQVLKARQLGMTTFWVMVGTHRFLTIPRLYGLVASSDPDKTTGMLDMMHLIIDELPWYLKPDIISHVAGEKAFETVQLGGIITRQHGTQKKEDIGRSQMVSFYLLTEVAGYSNPAKSIESSLLKTIHPSPNTVGVEESTAEGEGDWWHNRWLDNQKHYPEASDIRPIFLPWPIGHDIYPTATWAKERAAEIAAFKPPEHIQKHALAAAEFLTSNPLLKKYYPSDWQMPMAQQYYYHFEYQKAKRKGTLSLFLQEAPARDVDCFQAPHRSIFDAELIMTKHDQVMKPEAVYSITSDDPNEIPEKFKFSPLEHDRRYNQQKLTVGWTNYDKPRKYSLIPLIFQTYETFKPDGKLMIWEFPKDNEEYAIGIDCSFGLGADYSVIEVVRKGTFQEKEAQVAEFFTPWMNAEDLIPFAMVIGTMYSVFRRGKKRQPKVVIEIMAAAGETLQRAMQKLGWHEFHHRQYEDHVNLGPTSNLIGWSTDERTRKKVISLLISTVRDHEVDIRSRYLVNSIANLQRNEDTGKIAAFGGRHDDHAMAFGIVEASLSMDIMPGAAENQYRKRKEVEGRKAKLPERQLTSQETAPRKGDPIWKSTISISKGKMRSKTERYLGNP